MLYLTVASCKLCFWKF